MREQITADMTDPCIGSRLVVRIPIENGLFYERWSDGRMHVVKTDGPAPDQGGKVLYGQEVFEHLVRL